MKRVARRHSRLVPAPLRALAVLALALLIGDHVLPALHHALVVHEVCPEHGKLEHVRAAASTRFHHEKGPVVDANSTDAAHHDDCGSVPASPPRAPLVGSCFSAFEPAFGEPERPTVVSAAVSPADVVAFAPKQSPPA